MQPTLRDWLVSIEDRRVRTTYRYSGLGYVVWLTGAATALDWAWLARHHGALLALSMPDSTWGKWLATDLTSTLPDPGHLNTACAVLGCLGGIDHRDPDLVGFCVLHNPDWWIAGLPGDEGVDAGVGMDRAELNALAYMEFGYA